MVIAIDFDGTIVDNAYPNIGALKPNVVAVIRRLHDESHKIVINTCRTGEHAKDAFNFLIEHKIPFDALNENIPELVSIYPLESRKISADLYIDDRNLGGIPENWNEIYVKIVEHLTKNQCF